MSAVGIRAVFLKPLMILVLIAVFMSVICIVVAGYQPISSMSDADRCIVYNLDANITDSIIRYRIQYYFDKTKNITGHFDGICEKRLCSLPIIGASIPCYVNDSPTLVEDKPDLNALTIAYVALGVISVGLVCFSPCLIFCLVDDDEPRPEPEPEPIRPAPTSVVIDGYTIEPSVEPSRKPFGRLPFGLAIYECGICKSKPPSYTFAPCGHLCICGECFEAYPTKDTCIICRCQPSVPIKTIGNWITR